MRGRPSTYDPDLAATVCDAIADGANFAELIKQRIVPSWSTLFRWTYANDDFREAYERARETRAWKWAEEIVEIADAPAADMAAVGAAKLRVEARKWLLSKMLPRQFGDRVGVEVSGSIDLLALVNASLPKADESPLIDGEAVDVSAAADDKSNG